MVILAQQLVPFLRGVMNLSDELHVFELSHG